MSGFVYVTGSSLPNAIPLKKSLHDNKLVLILEVAKNKEKIGVTTAARQRSFHFLSIVAL